MLIYNTTYLVADRQFGPWIKWLREVHIPFMLNCGFMNPLAAKILTADSEQEGTSIAVQFQIQDLQLLRIWDEENAESLLNDLAERFGSEVLSFATVMEML
ncbi:MAG: DUF4286 family protein [Bacteroidia bacterium]|nr:DUF4286 family protein [Bacteroidia bacterium]